MAAECCVYFYDRTKKYWAGHGGEFSLSLSLDDSTAAVEKRVKEKVGSLYLELFSAAR